MELLVLVILYYLSQNPDFEKSVKPLLSELKNSEQALKFLEELSQFSKLFSTFTPSNKKSEGESTSKNEPPKQPPQEEKKESSVSPTSGIADGFIEELLEKYFKSNR